jgi:hypothetical protein
MKVEIVYSRAKWGYLILFKPWYWPWGFYHTSGTSDTPAVYNSKDEALRIINHWQENKGKKIEVVYNTEFDTCIHTSRSLELVNHVPIRFLKGKKNLAVCQSITPSVPLKVSNALRDGGSSLGLGRQRLKCCLFSAHPMEGMARLTIQGPQSLGITESNG